jgi:hypothetical protein
MTRWRCLDNELKEEGTTYCATFTMRNLDNDENVIVGLHGRKGNKASDLIGACRAVAQMLAGAGKQFDPPDPPETKTLN